MGGFWQTFLMCFAWSLFALLQYSLGRRNGRREERLRCTGIVLSFADDRHDERVKKMADALTGEP